MNTIRESISEKKHITRQNYIFALMAIATLLTVAMGQAAKRNDSTSGNRQNQPNKSIIKDFKTTVNRQLIPLVDYHAHLWSLEAHTRVTDPLLPPVELPEDLKRLIQDREQLIKERNPSSLAKIYTDDAVVLDALAPIWLKGKDAINLIAYNFGSFPLLPQAYQIEGSAGFIIGTYTTSAGESLNHVSNFSLFIRKGNDGKWRIAGETLTIKGPPVPKAATAKELVEKLDAAKIKRAVVLSTAYWFGGVFSGGANEYEKVRGENDWIAQQVSLYPDRLIGFCSFNPLKEYAIEELNRCAKKTNLKGLKLHFGSSRVNLLDPQHVEKIQKVFKAANQLKYPIAAHLYIQGKYGREHSEAFLNKIVTVAPDITIQIAHLGASGPGYHSGDALEVYAKAAVANDPRIKNLYFDMASMVTSDSTDENMALVVKHFRLLGIRRILFATDYSPAGENSAPKEALDAFRRLPLTEKEFRTIANNIAPYLR
jgi:predicted TIM-barrel fold metal-dependent hydrolase